jgi:predicted transcriptional regulator
MVDRFAGVDHDGAFTAVVTGCVGLWFKAARIASFRRWLDMTDKERVKEVVEAQPDDASYDEIVRELAFGRMVDRGIKDAREGRTISHEEMGRRIATWDA